MACLLHMTATPDLCACPAPPPRLSVPLLTGMAQKKGMDRSAVVRQYGTSELHIRGLIRASCECILEWPSTTCHVCIFLRMDQGWYGFEPRPYL